MNINQLRKEREKLYMAFIEMKATMDAMDRTLAYFEERQLASVEVSELEAAAGTNGTGNGKGKGHAKAKAKAQAGGRVRGGKHPDDVPAGTWNQMIGEAYQAGCHTPPEMWEYIQQYWHLPDEKKQAFYAARNQAKKKEIIPNESYLIGGGNRGGGRKAK